MGDPYSAGLFKENPFGPRRPTTGHLVAVLKGKLEGRQLQLIAPVSRVLQQGEIHELIATDEEAGPGQVVGRVAYLGFFEVAQGGVIVVGDELLIAGEIIGILAGFDTTHLPNHLNIVVKRSDRRTGLELGLEVGADVRFLPPPASG